MNNKPAIHQYPDADALTEAMTEAILERGRKAIAERGRFTLALSGGNAPKPVYRLLAERQDQLDWSRVLLFWSDERTVPADHAESNYGMAFNTLLSGLKTPYTAYRLRGEIDPHAAASEYEQIIRALFPGEDLPRFDLMLLGMGENGHTASLFPHTAVLDERQRLVAANDVDELKTWRLTFTVPLLNNARSVLFLISGQSKAEMLRRILHDEYQPHELPSQLIQPTDGELAFYIDSAAGSALPQS